MKFKGIFTGLLTFVLFACASPSKNSQAGPEWISNMHRLSAAHLHLIPFVADGRKFSDPTRREEVRRHLRLMAESSTGIVEDSKAPTADPLIQFTSVEFNKDVKRAYSAFESGDHQAARFALGRTSSYCISCHTRADRGIKDFELGWTSELSQLGPLQQVEYYLANRRYKTAFTKAESLAGSESLARNEPRLWIATVQRALAMVVRVNKSATQAERLVKLVAANKGAPYYIRRDAGTWLRDIQDWRATETKGPITFRTAVRLVQKAQKAGPRNSAALILHLRASGMLHELMEDSKSSRYGESLLYAGIVADSLRDLSLGSLDQYYYGSCINHQPHTELAEMCFSRLESSVRAANPFIEMDTVSEFEVNAQLAEFRKLAEVKNFIDYPIWKSRPWEEYDQWDQENESTRPKRER